MEHLQKLESVFYYKNDFDPAKDEVEFELAALIIQAL